MAEGPSYRTIEGGSVGEITEKKSRFIAHLRHVETEEEALSSLGQIRTEHAQARHNVYAYVLKGGRARYSDDGEPAQTAGLPTYETLVHGDLTDVICVTTRYFGGTLLGTGGLVRAYTQAAQAAIQAATILTITRCVDMTITVPYGLFESIQRMAALSDARVQDTTFAEAVTLRYRTAEEKAKPFQRELIELTHGQAPITTSEPFDAPL